MVELKDSQYQGGLRLLGGAADALQQAVSSIKRREEHSTIRRRRSAPLWVSMVVGNSWIMDRTGMPAR